MLRNMNIKTLLWLTMLICIYLCSRTDGNVIDRTNKLRINEKDLINSDNVFEESQHNAPYFTKPDPGPRRKSAGSYVNFNCKARGYPKPQLTWYKGNEPISKINRPFEPYSLPGWKMIINNLTPKDDGNYTCVATNKYGSVNRTFDLKVISRVVAVVPKIKEDLPGNHTALVGSKLELKCNLEHVDSFSPPLITFVKMLKVNGSYRDATGRAFKSTLQRCSYNDICYFDKDDGKTDRRPIDDATMYVLFNLTEADSGWYGCQAENEMGSSSSFGFVNVVRELPSDDEASNKRNIYIAGTGAISLIIIAGSLIAFFAWRYWEERKKKKYVNERFQKVYQWTKVVLIEKQISTTSNEPLLDPKITIETKKLAQSNSTAPPETEYELKVDDYWEINRDNLCLSQILGEGEFGKVLLAKYSNPNMTSAKIRLNQSFQFVAIKMLKEGHTDSDLINLVKEIEIMKSIGAHPNIVNMIGVCTQPAGKPLWLVMEYARHGNLKNYLTSFRKKSFTVPINNGYEQPDSDLNDLELKDMLRFGYEVAKGMEFLSQKGCVHRDLAARNVLVMEDKTVKIADFGLARDVKVTDYYRKTGSGRMPIRWMAPESVFERVSTTMSDVWSYGVLLYEILTLGDSPSSNNESIEVFLEHLREGRKLERPRNCPDNVYEVMCNCWAFHPDMRHTWPQLVDKMRKLYTDAQPLVYIDMSPL